MRSFKFILSILAFASLSACGGGDEVIVEQYPGYQGDLVDHQQQNCGYYINIRGPQCYVCENFSSVAEYVASEFTCKIVILNGVPYMIKKPGE